MEGGGPMNRLAMTLAGWMVLSWMAVHADDASPDAVEEQKQFQLADGFQIDLFAADPEIAKPIQIQFDARGRLWVVASESYPQLTPGAAPVDKVFVLEDRDHDGKADRTSVFADGLRIPTGIEIAGDTVYVGNATELIALTDTDGDGKADQRATLLSAFGTEDTHHLIHTFRYAPWGSLFFAQAVYIHSHVETPWGVRRLNGGGFWEYHQRSEKLDVFVTGMTNSWGLAFDRYGQAFGVDNDQYSVNYFFPGAHLIRTPDESHLLASLVEGKPKYCGGEFVGSAHFPEDWQGNFLTCDFRAHRLCRYKITDRGAGYEAEELPQLLGTANVAFRPVDIKFGPDGALYVCDWYNPIINHGEVDFRDPRRDKTRGRIWRIRHRDRATLPRVDLTTLPVDDLVSKLGSQDGYERHFAGRVLATLDPQLVGPALSRWSASSSTDLDRLRALWMAESVGDIPLARSLADKLLASTDPRVKSSTLRALARWAGRREVTITAEQLRDWARDSHPAVRAEIVNLARVVNTPEAMARALECFSQGKDATLDYVVRLVAREHRAVWLPILARGERLGLAADRWVMALLAVDAPEVVDPLLTFLSAGEVADEGAALALVGRHGQPKQLAVLVERARRTETAPAQRREILSALAEAHRLRQTQPEGDLLRVVENWLADVDVGTRDGAIKLAGLWRLEPLRDKLANLVGGSSTDATQGLAIDAIRAMGGVESIAALGRLLDSAEATPLRRRLLAALAGLDPQGSAERAIVLLASADPADAAELVLAFVGLQRGPDALANAIAKVTLPRASAEEAIKRVNASGTTFPSLVAALRKAGGMPAGERAFTVEQIRSLADQARSAGDPHRGKTVYDRKELACITCHRIRGSGGQVGPDLSTIGTSAPADYLVESLLLPSAKIKENYHTLVVVTDDGKVVTGIPERQSETELVLRQSDNTTVSIAKTAVDESKTGGSLMPTDVVDTLPTQDLIDLVRYLSELGKPGPFGPSQELTARRWRLIGPVDREEAKGLDGIAMKAETEGGWRDSLTTNDGWVYLREWALNREKPVLFGSTRITVNKAGKVHLTLQPGPKATYWLDGKPIEVVVTGPEEGSAEVMLAEGAHRLVVQAHLEMVPNIMRLRAYAVDDEVAFSLER
jgi:putative heme-binding domain-containing protein